MTEKPTLGRIVHWHPNRFWPQQQWYAAIIAHVHENNVVNLTVFEPRGGVRAEILVPKMEHNPDGTQMTDCWRWPPREDAE